MKYQVGIIGLGMIGESMLAEFIAHEQFEVRACWDLSEAVSRGIRDKFPEIPLAEGADAVLTHPDVDLVYIATPPVTHVDYGLQVAELGKGLLMEKPLSTDLADSRRLVEGVQAAGIPNAMNFAYGAGPLVDTIETVIAEEKLGELRSMEVRYQYPSWPLPNQLSASAWITHRDTGGMVREMFSHLVYLTQRVLGDLDVISATLSFPDEPGASEDFAMALLMCGDIPLWFMGGISSPHTPRTSDWTLNGSKGAIRIGEGAGLQQARDGRWVDFPVESSRTAVQARLDQLAAMLAGEAHRLPGVAEGYRVQEVIEDLLSHASHG